MTEFWKKEMDSKGGGYADSEEGPEGGD